MGWSEPFFANVLESVSNTTLQYNVTCFRLVLPIGIFFVSHRKCINNYETLKFLLLCLHDYYVINIDCLILLMIGIQIRLTKVH